MDAKHLHISTPTLIKKPKYSDLSDVHLKTEWTHPFSLEVKFKSYNIDDYKTLNSTS